MVSWSALSVNSIYLMDSYLLLEWEKSNRVTRKCSLTLQKEWIFGVEFDVHSELYNTEDLKIRRSHNSNSVKFIEHLTEAPEIAIELIGDCNVCKQLQSGNTAKVYLQTNSLKAKCKLKYTKRSGVYLFNWFLIDVNWFVFDSFEKESLFFGYVNPIA